MSSNFYPGCHVNKNSIDFVKKLIEDERFIQQVKLEIEATQLEATYKKLEGYMNDDNITSAQKKLLVPEFLEAKAKWFNFCCQNNLP